VPTFGVVGGREAMVGGTVVGEEWWGEKGMGNLNGAQKHAVLSQTCGERLAPMYLPRQLSIVWLIALIKRLCDKDRNLESSSLPFVIYRYH